MNLDFIITEIRRVILVGKEEYPEEKTSFSGKIKNNELIFHLSGESTYFFGDQIFEITPYTVQFFPKGDVDRYDIVRREQGECIDIFFRTDRPVADRAFIIKGANKSALQILFKKAFAFWSGKEEGYRFACLSVLYQILAELQKSTYSSSNHYAKIHRAVAEIHENFLSRKICVSELASLCNMKESYFGRLFKERFGVPPRQYIIQLKLNHACDLLRLERYTVTQVAYLCNFSDVYFFSRQFKNYIGITPTQFIKKYKSSK
ncbi:MAG: helix-turn-helix transcriptional regulator [Clostridia bacterium]|nr:helix-turn-helix transcriptional regulator [Clostridia bacterium]